MPSVDAEDALRSCCWEFLLPGSGWVSRSLTGAFRVQRSFTTAGREATGRLRWTLCPSRRLSQQSSIVI
jgi:hypothetical protein